MSFAAGADLAFEDLPLAPFGADFVFSFGGAFDLPFVAFGRGISSSASKSRKSSTSML